MLHLRWREPGGSTRCCEAGDRDRGAPVGPGARV